MEKRRWDYHHNIFPAYISCELDQLFIEENHHTDLKKKKKIMYRPHFDMSRGVFGLPGKQTKIEAYTKLTVAMC